MNTTQKQDSARLNGFEAALNTAKTACAKSTSALRNIVIHAEGVLKNKREVLEKALYTLPDIETRLGSKIERLQLSVTVLQTNMQELKPRVESFENIALADHDLELRLSDLDEEVIRLHGTVQGVLLEIIELKVPHASLHSFQPVDQSADTDSSRGNKNVMQSLASELQTVDTNPKDQSALLDVGNLSLTSPSKYGEQGCHGRRRREGSVKDDLTAGVIVNDKAGITCGCSSDSEDTAISDKSILEERTILDHRQNDEIEHNFQRFSQEGQKYTFACALLLLIYLFDEYIVIYFSERPLFEQLRRMSTGTRQPVDSLIIDTLIVMLLHVLALQV
ncbi:hypothetical protein BC629DRAFT_386846 [Irpex lacteus]|nr:hypothetical protein BC629DRAFT_386846 [Irpex lacteus]